MDICGIKYNNNGKIEYKLNFNDEWQELPHRPRKLNNFKGWQKLFQEKRKISAIKFRHLQDLLAVLPQDCHPFYNNLPHE